MLPRPVCPLAGHATLGQNVVVGSMMILLSWLCWGACQEEVCLDPRCLCNLTLPRFSVELPANPIVSFSPSSSAGCAVCDTILARRYGFSCKPPLSLTGFARKQQ